MFRALVKAMAFLTMANAAHPDGSRVTCEVIGPHGYKLDCTMSRVWDPWIYEYMFRGNKVPDELKDHDQISCVRTKNGSIEDCVIER